MILSWHGPERCRSINPDSTASCLIHIKSGEKCGCRAVRRRAAQKLRRFVAPAGAFDRAALVWWLPQIRAPAKTTNIATTPAETRIESIGIATSCYERNDYAETGDAGLDA